MVTTLAPYSVGDVLGTTGSTLMASLATASRHHLSDKMNERVAGVTSLCMLGAMVAGHPASAQRPATVVGPGRTPVSNAIAAKQQPKMDRTHGVPMNERHTRARQVTEMVTVWIVHDSENNEQARSIAATFTDAAFEQYLKSTLRWAPSGTAAWRTAQELAPSDYMRIDWRAVAAELLKQQTQPR